METKILVTGANGQLGNEFRTIAKSYPDIFLFTDINTLDLTRKEDAMGFFRSHTPGIIINCAAYTAVDNAETL
jgi:dTDP-4-dehydrorhamnose reductase